MKKGGTVYIITNVHNEVLYVGVTSDLVQRIQQHKNKESKTSFSSKYNLDKLVYYESFATIEEAIAEEKRIKGGSRVKKIKLIQTINPHWKDLREDVSKW
jgi:putative endonuclease